MASLKLERPRREAAIAVDDGSDEPRSTSAHLRAVELERYRSIRS